MINGYLIRAATTISELEEHHMHKNYNGLPDNNVENFIIQEYLGIKDIHNKKICEGDYCKVRMPCSPIFSESNFIHIVAEIRYIEERAGFKLYWESDYEDSKMMNYEYIDIDENLNIEIIGNIYQSDPSILKKASKRDFKIDEILD